MEVRLATPGDAATLARMRYEFRAAINPATESLAGFAARTVPWMAERLASNAAWRCWIVEEDAQIAGHLWLQLIEKIPNPAPELEVHAYITNVYVDPSIRGGGAGKMLMEAALDFCREARVDSVILWPTERSRTLYARHGFIEPPDILELILDSARNLH